MLCCWPYDELYYSCIWLCASFSSRYAVWTVLLLLLNLLIVCIGVVISMYCWSNTTEYNARDGDIGRMAQFIRPNWMCSNVEYSMLLAYIPARVRVCEHLMYWLGGRFLMPPHDRYVFMHAINVRMVAIASVGAHFSAWIVINNKNTTISRNKVLFSN